MAKGPYRQIGKIEAQERSGPYGAWRRDFCRQYRELLVQARRHSYAALEKKLAAAGGRITCRKGCTYCCFHYISAPLAHGIVIVDDLYDRKPVLRTFIRNYERWRHKGEAISKALDETRARAFASSMSIHEIIAVTRPLSMRYLESRIPCPFLEEEACLIYAVRPFPCSGQFSVSPPEWCSPAAAQDAVIHQLVTGDEDLLKFLELAGPGLMVSEMTLPTLIYRLLTEGASSVIRTGLREGADPGRDAMTKL